MSVNIGELLKKRASLNPHREAYVDSTARISFSELNDRCNRMANALLAHGVRAGDRVAIAMMNSPEFVETYLAIAKIGGIVVPLNWRLVPDELEFILKDSGAEILFYGSEFSGTFDELHSRGDATDVRTWIRASSGDKESGFWVDYETFHDQGHAGEPPVGARDDDLLYIMYTSGTTGLPKGVVHSHGTTFQAMLTFSASCDLRDADRYLAALPMFHVGALTPITLNVYRGVTSIVMREFDPARAWELFEKEKVTVSLLVPAMLNFMAQSEARTRYDYSTLRWIQSGASPLPVNLIRQFADMNIEIHQIYGSTETCGPACVIDAEHALSKIGSTGKPFFHTDVRVVNENGEDCKAGEPGEVWVKGDHIMLRYWNRPEATAETITQDGWLRTGDVASVDEDGFVYIQDRIKDMIISGGENVYPAEIENVLLSHPDITEVAVIGQPSKKWGESPFAVVVRNSDSLTEEAVLAHCKGKLAPFKLPRGAVFIDTIPRNANGKVLKRELRERFPGPAPS